MVNLGKKRTYLKINVIKFAVNDVARKLGYN